MGKERVERGWADAILMDCRKFESCHINFKHCSYHSNCFTPEYFSEKEYKAGRLKKKKDWKVSTEKKQKLTKMVCTKQAEV